MFGTYEQKQHFSFMAQEVLKMGRHFLFFELFVYTVEPNFTVHALILFDLVIFY